MTRALLSDASARDATTTPAGGEPMASRADGDHRAPHAPSFSLVITTTGGPDLQACLDSIAAARGPLPDRVVVVDHRRNRDLPLGVAVPARLSGRCVRVPSAARTSAAARNTGWRAARSPWVAFLADDVRVGRDWLAELAADVDEATRENAEGVQGRLSVPLPADRPPTESERDAAQRATAPWATADMAYRRDALRAVGGFDARFRQQHREDADLALRMIEAGRILRAGRRHALRQVHRAPWWASLRAQAGYGDDPLMRRLHGPDWRDRAAVPANRRLRHLTATAAGVGVVAALCAAGRPRVRLVSAGVLAGVWGALTAEFVAARLRPGPKDADEVSALLLTSVLIPPVATAHWFRGLARSAFVPSRSH